MADHLTKFIHQNKILRAISASLILICVLFNAAPTAAMTGENIFDPALAPVKDPGIITTGNITFFDGSTLDVEIGDTTPGVGGYDQIIVIGTVTIESNVTLSATAWGGYTPSVGDSYTIINNDGGDAVTGTFDSLAEGALISNFLGSGLTAQITYVGGDGNDVVLTVISPEPEIDIQYPAGTTIPDDSTHDLSIQTPGSTITLNYVYDNSAGTGVLTRSVIGSQNYVNISGITFTTTPPANLPAGSSDSLGFQFQVGSPGPFSFDWYINSNDADESPYNVHVAGLAGDNKHIVVQRPAGTAIADGGSDNVGNQTLGTVNLTYTVDNTAGLGALTVSDVTASNFTNAGSFSLDTAMPITIPAGGTSSFDISFNVLVNGAFGFDMDVVNDDADTSTYDIAVSGTGTGGAPEIDIQYPAGTSIADDSTHDLGTQTPGSTITLNYVYDNSAGTGVLTRSVIGSQNYVNISGITFTTTPPANLPAGSSDSLGFQFQVGSPGPFSFDWYINSNDADESQYNVHVAGLAGEPEIDIQRPAGTSIIDGGADVIGTPGVGAVNLTYIIDNASGTDQLSVTGVTAANESNVSGFALGTATPINIPAGGTDTFDISFNVNSAGTFSFDMEINNNDSDKTPYNIQVTGTASDLITMPGGNTSPQNGDVLTAGLSALNVQFNKEVQTGGAGVPGAADNPVNYLLVEDGPSNNGFDTLSCNGGVIADDVSISIDSVSYAAGSFTTTVNVNNGTPLSEGSYRLFVCGTTSVEDLFGNELNDGLADTLISFLVEPEEEAKEITTLPATGFAPGQVTTLPAQPALLSYANTAMVLEIPSLDQHMSIISVPQSMDSWNVTWLGANAGYLPGTAFPTWAGNTVLTGHVWDAFNQPGPFANLKTLRYGEQFYIHAFGITYIYEVRENTLLQPTQVSKALQHEDYDWVTLLTCEKYDAEGGDYELRRMVRAVLVQIR